MTGRHQQRIIFSYTGISFFVRNIWKALFGNSLKYRYLESNKKGTKQSKKTRTYKCTVKTNMFSELYFVTYNFFFHLRLFSRNFSLLDEDVLLLNHGMLQPFPSHSPFMHYRRFLYKLECFVRISTSEKNCITKREKLR